MNKDFKVGAVVIHIQDEIMEDVYCTEKATDPATGKVLYYKMQRNMNAPIMFVTEKNEGEYYSSVYKIPQELYTKCIMNALKGKRIQC